MIVRDCVRNSSQHDVFLGFPTGNTSSRRNSAVLVTAGLTAEQCCLTARSSAATMLQLAAVASCLGSQGAAGGLTSGWIPPYQQA